MRRGRTEDTRQMLASIDAMAVAAAARLFEAYGIAIVEDRPGASASLGVAPLVSAIGFSSEGLSGALILALPQTVLERTLPAEGANLADWSRELANQLLGRFKNQLIRHGLYVSMGLPVVFPGDLAVVPTSRARSRHYVFSSAAGPVSLRLDMDLGSSLKLEPEATATVIQEGEQLFF